MWREVRYLIASVFLLALYLPYVLVYQMKNRGGWWLFVFWGPLGVIFALLNIAFNLTIGTFIFFELPKQLFFSDRVRSTDEQFKHRFRLLLNSHDPDHIE